jgi:hypothetical protein
VQNVPAGQGIGSGVPATQKKPAGQLMGYLLPKFRERFANEPDSIEPDLQ